MEEKLRNVKAVGTSSQSPSLRHSPEIATMVQPPTLNEQTSTSHPAHVIGGSEVAGLQAQLAALEKNRAGIADELVELVRKNDELTEQASLVPELKTRLLNSEHKLDQVMQMYGEKVEEV